MFFKSAKRTAREAESRKIIHAIYAQKEEINRRLAEMNAMSDQLSKAVAETQTVSTEVMKKLRTELKVAKKSIFSICRRLQSGAILLNWRGEIVMINESAERMFGISEDSYLHKRFRDLVSGMGFEHGSKLPVKPQFFTELSNKILHTVKCSDENCTTADKVKSELPSYFDLENDVATELQLNKGGKLLKLNFAFSILDNDPEQVTDVMYIFLFRDAKHRQLESA